MCYYSLPPGTYIVNHVSASKLGFSSCLHFRGNTFDASCKIGDKIEATQPPSLYTDIRIEWNGGVQPTYMNNGFASILDEYHVPLQGGKPYDSLEQGRNTFLWHTLTCAPLYGVRLQFRNARTGDLITTAAPIDVSVVLELQRKSIKHVI